MPFLLSGIVVFMLAGCDSPNQPRAQAPAAVELIRGDTQSAGVGQTLTDSLEVRVLNRHRDPLPGVEVRFAVTAGGGIVSPETVRTDSRGAARAAWTLGVAAGVQRVEARVGGRNLEPVEFTARASPGTIAELVMVSGDEQTGTVGELLPEPLVVRVRDEHGNGVPGVEVEWTAHTGSISPGVDTTDADGFSRVRWTLSTHGLSQFARAYVEIGEGEEPTTFDVLFTVTPRPGPLVTVYVVPEGSFGTPPQFVPDSLAVLHPTTAQLRAIVVDIYGNEAEPTNVGWSSSDPQVVDTAPGNEGEPRVSLQTHAGGTALVQALAGGVGGTLRVRVAAVQGPFRAVDTGLDWPFALNDLGEVAGPIVSGELMIWRDGQRVMVPVPGGYGGGQSVRSMNNTGAIIVYQQLAGHTGIFGLGYTTILKGGGATTIPVGGATGVDINDEDVLVGAQLTDRLDRPWSRYRAFLWNDGLLTYLFPDESEGSSFPVAVNGERQVALSLNPSSARAVHDPNSSTAALWEAGHSTHIPRPDPACLGWIPVDLDASGNVLLNCGVGGAGGPVPPQPWTETLSFLWNGTAFTRLTPITRAMGLNDRGEVVGMGPDGAYLWRDGGSIRLLEANGVVRMWINNSGEIAINFRHSNIWRAHVLVPIR